jgi:hypothetical protein
MNARAAKIVAGPLIASLLAVPLSAQDARATMAGTVTAASGAPVPGARVSVTDVASGRAVEATTDAAGAFSVPDLTPGHYEVTVTAQGLGTRTSAVTLAAGDAQRVDVSLAPPTGPPAPSLGDLGFGAEQTRGSAEEQARLDKRSHMLKVHQRLGLITTAPLIATLATAPEGEDEGEGGGSSRRGPRGHAILGGVTAGLYLTTASFAIFAPKVKEKKTRGPIRLHKTLAWIHGTGMVLTPILGGIAYRQRTRGERVHGIAKAHSTVAVATGAAYGLAMLSVTIKF